MKAWWEGLDNDDQMLVVIILIPVVTFLIMAVPVAAVGLGFLFLMGFMHHTDAKKPSIADRYFDELAHRRGWWEEDED